MWHSALRQPAAGSISPAGVWTSFSIGAAGSPRRCWRDAKCFHSGVAGSGNPSTLEASCTVDVEAFSADVATAQLSSPSNVLCSIQTGVPGTQTYAELPSGCLGRRLAGLTAGAETGLSCSHLGCATVPRPLRRRVLGGCASKGFTPSLAFAYLHQARLPVGPLRGCTLRRGRLRSMLRTGGLHPPNGGRDPVLRRPGLPARRRAATK